MKHCRSLSRTRSLAVAVAIGLAASLASNVAHAHFRLLEPESWMSQNALGDPQKTGPCGEAASGTPSAVVTPFEAGQMITLTVDETVFHPGHYRVALSVNDRSELPQEPAVTPGASECGSVPIQDPPVFPVLADGIFAHTSALSGEQTIQVQLPTDVTCDHCTLQVLEFMSAHGAPCFYYHCADISISAPGAGGGGESGGGSAGNGTGGGGMGGGAGSGAAGAAAGSGGESGGSADSAGAGGGQSTPVGTGDGAGAGAGAGTGGTAGTAGMGGAAPGGSAAGSAAPSPTSTTTITNTNSNSGSCACLAPSGGSSHLTLIATLAMLGTVLARRRRKPLARHLR